MSTIADLALDGYEIAYSSSGYDVHHLGTKVASGGRAEYGTDTPFETRNWRAVHRLCAVWVAERHRNKGPLL